MIDTKTCFSGMWAQKDNPDNVFEVINTENNIAKLVYPDRPNKTYQIDIDTLKEY